MNASSPNSKTPSLTLWLRRLSAALTLLLLISAVILLVLSHQRSQFPDPGFPLTPTAEPAPDFSGVNQASQPLSLHNLRGQVVVLAPIYIHCRDICPLTVAAFARIHQEVEQAGWGQQVTLITATVDPERDTSAVLQAYANQVGAKWIFLTGTPQQIADMWQAYGVAAIKVPLPTPSATGDYDMMHNSFVAVIDQQGQLRYRLLGVAGGRELTAEEVKALSLDNRLPQRMPGWEPSDVVDDIRAVLAERH